MPAFQNVLAIVDVQYPFVNHDDLKVLQIAAAAKKAREQGHFIIVIEDTHGCPTHDPIKDVLKGYTNTVSVTKSQWDGSLQIEIALTNANIRPQEFTVCGAYGEQCVLATMVGLRDRFPMTPIRVLRECCCPAPTGRFADRDWERQGRQFRLLLA